MAMTATLTHPGYSSGYDSYAYEPAYAAPVYTPPSYYGPVTYVSIDVPGLRHQLHRAVARAPAARAGLEL